MHIDVYPYSIAFKHRFRGLLSRDGVLLRGPGGWAEASPFWDYGSEYSARWLLGALIQASGHENYCADPREPQAIECNTTIPAVDAQTAYDLACQSGARTAKVKIAEHPGSLAEDCARLEAVRSAIGSSGKIRIDVNGRWDVPTAQRLLPILDRAAAGLEYAEQPVMDTDDLALLHRKINVPLAADESIRRSVDPLKVARLHAADVAVIKVQPLGGIRRALTMADRLGLPCTLSSALETPIGLYSSLLCAALIKDLPYACGLGTLSLFDNAIAHSSYCPHNGIIEFDGRMPEPDYLADVAAPEPLAVRWQQRFADIWGYLASLGVSVWEHTDSARDAQLFIPSGHTPASAQPDIYLPHGEKITYTFHTRPAIIS